MALSDSNAPVSPTPPSLEPGQKKRQMRLAVRLSLVCGLLCVGVAYIFFLSSVRTENLAVQKEERRSADQLQAIFLDGLDVALGDLNLMVEMLEQPENWSEGELSPAVLGSFEDFFFSLATHRQNYDQIRFLNQEGMEVVRVNWKDGLATAVPAERLQNKANRYYFTDAIKQNKNDVFVSPFDLNVEHGEVERPFKPMLRLGRPIVDPLGQKRGASF